MEGNIVWATLILNQSIMPFQDIKIGRRRHLNKEKTDTIGRPLWIVYVYCKARKSTTPDNLRGNNVWMWAESENAVHKCFVSIFVAWTLCVGASHAEEIFSETLDIGYKECTMNEGFADRAVIEGMSLNTFEVIMGKASERCGFPGKITAYAIRRGTIS